MAKTLFPQHGRSSKLITVDPRQVRIIGGAAIKDRLEQGTLDTEHKYGEHKLWRSGLDMPIPAERMASFSTDGIVVPPSGIRDDDGAYCVVVGATRIRAGRRLANEAEKEGRSFSMEVAVMVDNDDHAERAVLVENYQRKVMGTGDLLRDVLDKSKKGWSAEDIASACALGTAHYVKQLIRFAGKAIPSVRAAVEAGKLTLVAGLELAKLEGDKQAAALEEALKSEPGRSGGAGLKAAKRARAAAEGSDGEGGDGGTPAVIAPGKKLLKKALASLEQDVANAKGQEALRLSAAAEAIRWALTGDGPPWLTEYAGYAIAQPGTEEA